MTAAIAAWAAVPEWEAVLRLVVASALGGLIGLEREWHGRSAGMRTQLLVALGACLAMEVSLHFAVVYGGQAPDSTIRVDPARVAYGVMLGVGFLGAGNILQYGTGVRGLTTAASLWCSAAIGMAAGFGMYLLAGVSAALVLLALTLLGLVERLVPARVTRGVTVLTGDTSPQTLDRLGGILGQDGVRIVNVSYSDDLKAGEATVTFQLSGTPERIRRAVDRLRSQAGEIRSLRVE